MSDPLDNRISDSDDPDDASRDASPPAEFLPGVEALDLLDAAMYLHRRDGRIVEVNDRACRLIGYEREEMLEMGVADIIDGFDAGRYGQIWREVAGGDAPKRFDSRHVRKDGTILPVRVTLRLRDDDGEPLMLAIVQDRSEQDRLHRRLAELQRRHEDFLERINDGAFILDAEGRFTYVNSVIVDRVGVPREQIIGQRMPELAVTEQREMLEAIFRRGMAGENPGPFEMSYYTPHGVRRTVEINPMHVRDEGRIVGVMGISRDVTRRRAAEQRTEKLNLELRRSVQERNDRLSHSEQRYRYLFDHAMTANVLVSPDAARIIEISRGIAEAFGTTPEAIQTLDPIEVIVPEDRTLAAKILQNAARGKPLPGVHEITAEINNIRRTFLVTAGALPVRENGQLKGFLLNGIDVTERKRTAGALAESDALLRRIFDASPAAIFLKDAEGRFQMVNRTMADNHGVSPEEMIGRRDSDFRRDLPHRPEQIRRFRRDDAEVLRTGESKLVLTEPFTDAEGVLRWFQTVKAPFRVPGQPDRLLGMAVDITERIRTEEQLQEANRSLRELEAIINRSPVIGVLWRVDEGLSAEYVSDNVERELGYPAEGFLSGKIATFEVVHPDDAPGVREFVERHLVEGRNEFELTYRILRADGEVRIMENRSVVRRDADGRATHIQAIFTDVTERERAAERMRRSERRFREVLDSARELVYRINLEDLGYEYLSPSVEQVLGFSVEAMKAMGFPGFAERIHPADAERLSETLEAIRRGEPTGSPALVELRWRHADGTWHWYNGSQALLRDADGQAVAVIGTMHEVTQRKRAEQALRESEEKYRTLVETAGDSIATVNGEGRVLFVNRAGARRLERPRDEVIGKRLGDLFPRKIAERQLGNICKVLRSGRGQTVEAPVVFGEETRCQLTRMQPQRDHEGRIVAVTIIATDITDQKATERALRESEEKYRALTESTNDLVYAANPDGTLRFCSTVVRRYGYAPDEVEGRNLLEFIHPDDRERVGREFARTIADAAEFLSEFRIIGADGGVHWVEDRGRAQRDVDGAVTGLAGVLRDVTERRRAAEALREARGKLTVAREQERRRLAAELHDSLGQQFVALKIALQSRLTECGCGQEARGLLKQCDELVRQVRDLSHGLYPPTLENFGLAPALRKMLAGCSGGEIAAELRCPADLTDRRFGEDLEIALFRIAQEAVSNAVRHARCSRITVALRRNAERFALEIADDGTGFDPDAERAGLGLNTMFHRAEAAGAAVEIDSGPGGTTVTVRWRAPATEA